MLSTDCPGQRRWTNLSMLTECGGRRSAPVHMTSYRCCACRRFYGAPLCTWLVAASPGVADGIRQVGTVHPEDGAAPYVVESGKSGASEGPRGISTVVHFLSAILPT